APCFSKGWFHNKQFKEEQLRNSHVKGIFTLGKETNQNLEKIESKKESISKENEKKIKNEKNLQDLTQEKEKEEEDFTDSCWEKLYKKNEEDFKETLEGFKRKEKFKEKILREFENDKHNQSEIVGLEKLKEKIGIVFGENQTELALLECDLTDFDSIENHSIWEQKIVGSGDVAIADLIKKLSNEDWVAQGREYVKDNSICPFCQKETITKEFKKQLESYFDTSYQESTDTIKKIKEDYTNKTAKVLERLNEIIKTEQNKLDTENLKRIIETLRSKINVNQQKILDKSKEMSRSFKLDSTKNEIDAIKDLIAKANEKITNHNETIKDIKTQKETCVEQTWKFLINEFKNDIQEYNKKYCGLKKGINNLEKEISENQEKVKKLENEIKELEKNMVSIKPIVNEINALLKGYGFTNFGLACTEDEKFYRIQRENGQLVGETLSEGEVTFITFLYYYHLAQGSLKENDISKNKVLVIDDPISSLDSNILFIVSVLVKDLMKETMEETMEEKTNIKQIIILTHNTYFYKEITLEYDLKRYQGKYSFWIIKKDNNVSKIKDCKENPIKNSYELLWQDVKQAKENNISWVSLQNVMRRIIEYYFSILGGFKHNDNLSECFENIEEKQVCNSFISWFNDGSHGILDDLFVQSQDTSIETYLKVFEKIFKETGHEAHFKMMMRIK
ncbi:hypothetical protein HMPREF1430_00988, partial [Helicobacter pylori GAM96Ai]|uniref:ATP-binding protein n=1 Tax=Helicobacter pylori TaxID=210 RepID=UPI0002B91D8D